MKIQQNKISHQIDADQLTFGSSFLSDKADLHIHSFYSDGIYSPEYLVKLAESAGFRAISITDHDSIDGYLELLKSKDNFHLEIIPGIEFSCHYKNNEYHILSYMFDVNSSLLNDKLLQIRQERELRAEKIIKKLSRLNVNITMEQIKNVVGMAPITRPHIATVLFESGYVPNLREAFNTYIGEGRLAYQKKTIFHIKDCFKLIKAIGGISVLAHPGNSINQSTIFEMIELGLDGIEVINPSHTPELVSFYKKIAEQYWLIMTGGSDFHGNRDNDFTNFGKYFISYSSLKSMELLSSK